MERSMVDTAPLTTRDATAPARSARQHIRLVETRADTVSGDTALIEAVGRLIDGIDRK